VDKVTIRNTTNKQPYIITDDGQRIALTPHETRTVALEVAFKFIEQYPKAVVREQEINAVAEDIPVAERVYLYNATGGPDEKETLIVTKFTKQGQVHEEIKNPKHEAFTLSYELDGGQRLVGEDLLNLASRKVRVAPYTRMAFTKDTAENLLRRDAGQLNEMRGCIRHARAPQSFEPDDNWDLEDLQLYAKTIDSHGLGKKVGKTVQTLEKEITRGKHEGKTLETVIAEAKTALLKMLFFRIVDPAYRLPDKDEWTRLKAAREKSKTEPKTEGAPKKRGRPKKDPLVTEPMRTEPVG
jgi:hypothetical protein